MKKIDFKKICEKYREEALKTLVNDIKINSVYDPSTISGSTPYGKGVADCFKFLKEIALKDGFKVDECDGRCLEISYGEGKNLIYIFAHQDVVPVNGKWKFDPFSGVIEDNKVYAADSLNGELEIPEHTFQQIWQACGSQCIGVYYVER